MAGALHIPIHVALVEELLVAGFTQGRVGIHWMAVHWCGLTVCSQRGQHVLLSRL